MKKEFYFILVKCILGNIETGQDYSKINKCISILFIDFNINNLKNIHKYITKWNLREEKYTNIILTDAIEIYIIEMSKVLQYKENSKLDTWIKFIINSGDIDMKDADESMKKAKKVLTEISKDEHERYLAHLRQKFILDQKAIEETGFENGFKQGSKESTKKIAKRLKQKNISITDIIEITGLTKKEIEML